MRISHRFGSFETLSRARYWLTRHGFQVAPVDPETHDASRLSLNVDFSKAAAALALIDSIEQSDPNGWPGFYSSLAKIKDSESRPDGVDPQADRGSSTSPIHWRHADEDPANHSIGHKVSEYMLSRWE